MPYLDFQKIKQAISVERAAQVLGLEMKQAQHQLRGPCPACQTEDPRALAITPAKGWYCHAAQLGGDTISLAGHILGLSARDAAQWLQDTLPEAPEAQQAKPRQASQKAPEAREFDPTAYQAKLAYSDAVAALGLSEADAKELGIGEAPNGIHRGQIAFPIRWPTGEIACFVSADGLKFPKTLLPRKVVQLKRA